MSMSVLFLYVISELIRAGKIFLTLPQTYQMSRKAFLIFIKILHII